MTETQPSKSELRELAALFLKLGTTAFGGPAVHIAMMEDEVVRRRRWMNREAFLDLLAATNLIPGPNSTEMAIHVGYVRAGWRGLIVAGLCFIIPAMLIVGVLAHFYTLYGTLPAAKWLLYGIKPVIVAVIAQAVWVLGKASLTSLRMAVLLATGIFMISFGLHELVILLGTGFVALMARLMRRGAGGLSAALLIPAVPAAAAAAPSAAFSAGGLFLFFAKTGAVLYGSGYVLIAFIENGLVDRYGWLTRSELLDAVAAGQITPGPLFTTATFIGYLLGEKFGTGGVPAALTATAGIFLPAFVFVGVTAPFLPRLRQSQLLAAFLDGLICASLALMGAVLFSLTRDAVSGILPAIITIASAVLLVRFRISSTWLIAGGAAAGWIARSV